MMLARVYSLLVLAATIPPLAIAGTRGRQNAVDKMPGVRTLKGSTKSSMSGKGKSMKKRR